jgi:hypothetical protein
MDPRHRRAESNQAARTRASVKPMLCFGVILATLARWIIVTEATVLPSPARALDRPRQPQATPSEVVEATSFNPRLNGPRATQLATWPPRHLRRQVPTTAFSPSLKLPPPVIVMNGKTLAAFPKNYCGFEYGDKRKSTRNHSRK